MRDNRGSIEDLLLVGCAGFSFLYAWSTSAAFPFHPVQIGALTIGAIGVWFLLFYNKWVIRILGGVIGGFLVIGGAYAIRTEILGDILQNIGAFFRWAYDHLILGREMYDPVYGWILIGIMGLLMIGFVYICMIRRFTFIGIFLVGLLFFMIQWGTDTLVSNFSFYLYVFVIAQLYIKRVYIRKGEETALVNQRKLMLWSAPFCMIVIGLSLVMNMYKPASFPWLRERLSPAYAGGNFVADGEAFSVGLVGFGEGDSTLGGSVRLNDVIALRVKALQPIYLKGAGKDFYTGWAWINTDTQPLPIQDPNNRLNVDLYEMTEGSKLLTEEEDFLSRYFTEDRVQITYENLKLKSLFTPLKVKTIEPLQQVVVDSSGGASSIKLLRKNDSYAIETYYVRHSSEELQEILRRSRKGLYEEALGGGEGTRLTEEELIVLHSIAKNIYGKYVQLPDTVPSEVYELARSITEGYDTTYDKVRAVERYMYNNYTYTLTPDPLPEEGDFSAHFLLDSKKGYCTYYATGMAVLLRSLDIPTRYVEGYMIPPSLQKTGSEYIVTNERAHAWVECYFEGFGWLSFDPTFYRESTYRSYTGEATGMYEEYYESLYEQQMQQSFDWMEGEFWADRGAESLKSYGDMAGYILGGIFVILLFVQSLRQSWKLQWYQQKKKRVYIQKIYEKYLKMLALQELQMADGETPLEYAMRINPYVNDHSIDLIKTTEIFLRARYSTMEISPEDFRQMGDFYLHLRRKTKQNTNRVVYWMYRCILGTI